MKKLALVLSLSFAGSALAAPSISGGGGVPDLNKDQLNQIQAFWSNLVSEKKEAQAVQETKENKVISKDSTKKKSQF